MAHVAVAVACIAFPAVVAAAQAPSSDGGASEVDPGVQFAMDEAARVAILDLRLLASPTPDDYTIAANAFDLASGVVPTDSAMLRRVIDAAWNAADRDLLNGATRRLYRLDPDDTINQLRLLVSSIASLQTVPERITAYERVLGASIDPGVKSRLALDAALLHREQGELDRFVDLLTLATELDGSHKEAASLAATYIGQNSDDPIAILEAQLNLLFADPLDPNVHLSIANALASEGALSSAARFHARARRIITAERELPSTIDQQRMAIQWQGIGPDSVLSELVTKLTVRREQQAARLRFLEEQGDPLDDERAVEEVRLPPEEEKFRILAADAAGDLEATTAAMNDYEASISEILITLLDPERRPPNLTPAQAANQASTYFVDLQVMRLWVGQQVEEVRESYDAFVEVNPGAKSGLDPLLAWMTFREGDAAAALAQIDELELPDSLPVRLLRGLANESLGFDEAATSVYQSLVRETPLTAMGSWAKSRIDGLTGRSDPRTQMGVQLELIGSRVPRWLDDMVQSSSSFMMLSVEPVNETIASYETTRLRLRLRNISPIPLAVGPGRPIVSRALLSPKLEPGIDERLNTAVPEVVEIDRRLRLLPRETMEVILAADLGETGLLLQANSRQTIRARWRVLQGFRVGPRGALVAGELGLSSETPPMVKVQGDAGSADLDSIGRRIANASGSELAAALVALRAELYRLISADVGTSSFAMEELAELAADRFANAAPMDRLMLVTCLPNAAQSSSFEPFDAAVRTSLTDATGLDTISAAVFGLALLTRVDAPDDALLGVGLESDDPRVAALAEAIGARLQAGVSGFASASFPELLDPERSALDPTSFEK